MIQMKWDWSSHFIKFIKSLCDKMQRWDECKLRWDFTKKMSTYSIMSSLFPTSYSSRDSALTLSDSDRSLTAENATYHLLLKEFNLLYSFWWNYFRSTQHAAADQLLNMMNKHDLSLILLRNIVTWETRNIFSIIDLTFEFSYLANQIKHCIRSDIN